MNGQFILQVIHHFIRFYLISIMGASFSVDIDQDGVKIPYMTMDSNGVKLPYMTVDHNGIKTKDKANKWLISYPNSSVVAGGKINMNNNTYETKNGYVYVNGKQTTIKGGTNLQVQTYNGETTINGQLYDPNTSLSSVPLTQKSSYWSPVLYMSLGAVAGYYVHKYNNKK
jgi:hypothetical protein